MELPQAWNNIILMKVINNGAALVNEHCRTNIKMLKEKRQIDLYR